MTNFKQEKTVSEEKHNTKSKHKKPVKKSKNHAGISFTKKDQKDASRYDKHVKITKTGKNRYKYLHRINKRELYLNLGHKSFEEYLKDALAYVYSPAQITRLINYFKITNNLGLKLTDYTEGLLRPLTPFLSDCKSLYNIWDLVQSSADGQPIKPSNIHEAIISYQEHVLMRAATNDEKKTVKKILKLMDTLPSELRKQLGKQLGKQLSKQK